MTHEALSDLELLAGWRRGDREMAAALYRRYYRPIVGFFRRNVYDRSQIDALVQDTFVALLESKTEVTNLQAFLFRTAFFKFTGYLRRRHGEPIVGDEITLVDTERPVNDFEPDPEFIALQREDKRLLMRAIRRLPPKYQWILELSYWENKTAPEVAEILELPLGTVRSRLRLAKAELDSLLAGLQASQDAMREATMSTTSWQRKVQAEIFGRPEEPL